MKVRWGFAALGFFLVSGCGNDKTITAQFTASRQPQLIVLVSMSLSGATSEDLKFKDNPEIKIGGNPNALLACAKYLAWIRPDVSSGGLSGKSSCTDLTPSTGLAGYFADILSTNIEVPTPAYSTSAFTLKNNSSGFVFFVSFYDLNTSAGSRCFQLTASEVSGGKFLALDTGAKSSTLLFSVTDETYPATGDTPATDRSKCFRF